MRWWATTPSPSGAQFMAYVAVITLIVVGTRLQQAKTR